MSKIHYLLFSEMIPDDFQQIWRESTESDFFKLKICGAGGGGFILGMTKDWGKTEEVLSGFSYSLIFNF